MAVVLDNYPPSSSGVPYTNLRLWETAANLAFVLDSRPAVKSLLAVVPGCSVPRLLAAAPFMERAQRETLRFMIPSLDPIYICLAVRAATA